MGDTNARTKLIKTICNFIVTVVDLTRFYYVFCNQTPFHTYPIRQRSMFERKISNTEKVVLFFF